MGHGSSGQGVQDDRVEVLGNGPAASGQQMRLRLRLPAAHTCRSSCATVEQVQERLADKQILGPYRVLEQDAPAHVQADVLVSAFEESA